MLPIRIFFSFLFEACRQGVGGGGRTHVRMRQVVRNAGLFNGPLLLEFRLSAK